MSLGNRIHIEHPESSVISVNYPIIYIADFTERTKGQTPPRGVEITSSQQLDPSNSTMLMDSLTIHNDKNYDIDVVLLDDYVFHNIVRGRVHTDQHCEGCFSIKEEVPNWLVFIELKDCNPGSSIESKKDHAFKAKRQIYNVIKDLRGRGLITSQRIYGIISWPQYKTEFNSMITGVDIFSVKKYQKYTGVLYCGANEAYIISKDDVSPIIVP